MSQLEDELGGCPIRAPSQGDGLEPRGNGAQPSVGISLSHQPPAGATEWPRFDPFPVLCVWRFRRQARPRLYPVAPSGLPLRPGAPGAAAGCRQTGAPGQGPMHPGTDGVSALITLSDKDVQPSPEAGIL